jgi:DNA polymerase-3 subunit alpha
MGGDDSSSTLHQKPDVPEWPENEILAYEKEMLGLYVSSHPLARYAQIFERYANIRPGDIPSLRDGQEVVIGGMIGNVKEHLTKRGTMAFITLETLDGTCEITAFSDVYEPNRSAIVADAIVMVPARVTVRNGEPGLLAVEIVPIVETEARLTRAVHVRLDGVNPDDEVLEKLALALGERQGSCDVYLHCLARGSDEVTIHASSACCVAATEQLREEVGLLVGEGNLWFTGGNGYPRHNSRA